jgi:solute carrier family 25 iron transporter 28/37
MAGPVHVVDLSEKCFLCLYSVLFSSMLALCVCVVQILRAEKFSRLYRGMGAVIIGAIPSHAVSFSTYEFVKQSLGGNKEGHHPFLNGIAGA